MEITLNTHKSDKNFNNIISNKTKTFLGGPLEQFKPSDVFVNRHIGISDNDAKEMLQLLKLKSFEEMVEKTVPKNIQLKKNLDLPAAKTESGALTQLKKSFSKNQIFKNYIGMGYYDCIVPNVIQRNILENPSWYTQYTPYQSEISQGRLEALLNYQTLIADLTGLPIANASLLDEATAAAEAMTFAYSLNGDTDKNIFLVSENCHPQTIEVIETRAKPLNIKVKVQHHERFEIDEKIFAAIVQYPTSEGDIFNYEKVAKKVHDQKGLMIAACDLLALTLLTAPGEWGADVAVGNSQRFGVPLGFGGPHAAFFATKEEYKRRIPGRIVGVSIDREGRRAVRLALQTREQHIRRDKATSNICTAQVLLAIMASMYAVYHGPEGIKNIALRIHSLTHAFAKACQKAGIKILNTNYFDTLKLELKNSPKQNLLKAQINVRYFNQNTIGVSIDETTTPEDLEELIKALGGSAEIKLEKPHLPENLTRQSKYLQHSVFNYHHSETEMLRYMKQLENKDLSLTHSMIPLGSCTMKLNATAEMIPVSWPQVNSMHPFAPAEQTKGYAEMLSNLEGWLAEITGFAATSLQPNAGSQGEYSGLLVIHQYHQAKGEGHRNICLIPTSAHGTNPASAVMAGMKVVTVLCDNDGNIDVADLKKKASEHQKNLSCLMVTYPSTHGVYEESIIEICKTIHEFGGQVYLDGANLNALVGISRPGDFGADVCHLNLHKTFCIPHGGGGPGMGPIAVAKHLAPFLPGHKTIGMGDMKSVSAVSAAPWGSASILPIPWMYISMMGPDGLRKATEVAILNANYIAKKLDPYFPILYKGKNGLVAHECIINLQPMTDETGVTAEDVAKRLMDYGFHAPTLSWPVTGTVMVEPTESESKAELDRFCEAMIAIHKETQECPEILKMAPHTAEDIAREDWKRSYTRVRAAYPLEWVKQNKFWPSVARIDNPHGDKNLFCTCS